MTIKNHIYRAMSLPPRVVALKALQLLFFQLKSYFIEFKDTISSTYSALHPTSPQFQHIFPKAPDPQSALEYFPELDLVIKKTINHEFDLLGSGWTKSLTVKDFKKSEINFSNKKRSQEIAGLISTTYSSIDWHSDLKSQYRWKPNTWWFRIPYGHINGVDIKMPWELSRCHHLSWLALGYGVHKKNSYAQEIQDQTLDFISGNPPRYGVNWRCPMDVAIRAANWILAYEWLRLYGWNFDETFEKVFASSLYDHGKFIFSHLEIDPDGFRGNHYLANICGLIFIAEFLSPSLETKKWLDFGYPSLIEEMSYQFFDEGSNFEGSTSYHRLSAEMVLYTTIAIALKGKYHFPNSYLKRLYKMHFFSKALTRPDGDIVQIGDCDNGRFFKIQPIFKKNLEERHLTQRCLIEGIQSLFEKNTFPTTIEGRWIKDLELGLEMSTGDSNPSIDIDLTIRSEIPDEILSALNDDFQFSEHPLKKLELPFLYESIPFSDKNLEWIAYPKFGVYVWKNSESFLSFRCGRVGQRQRGGHDHNDQLSIELYTKGKLIKYDPGTAIYTAYPEIRNKYRSVEAHTSPQVINEQKQLIEPGPLNQGLFSLNGGQDAFIIKASERTFCGYQPRTKTVRILKRRGPLIDLVDICLERSWKIVPQKTPPPLSIGYGLY